MPSSGSGSASGAVAGPSTGYAAYPVAADVQALLNVMGMTNILAQAGVTFSAAWVTQADIFCANAVQEFEGRTGRQFLADAATSVRYFDPPYQTGFILPTDDFITTPTIVYAPNDGNSSTLDVNDDFNVEPYNAITKEVPYNRIRFYRQWWIKPFTPNQMRAVQVTARWGYGDLIPADAWQAMCYIASEQVLGIVGAVSLGGLNKWSEAQTSEDYGNMGYQSGLTRGWGRRVTIAMQKYKKVRI